MSLDDAVREAFETLSGDGTDKLDGLSVGESAGSGRSHGAAAEGVLPAPWWI